MKIKLYSFATLCEMNNPWIDDKCYAYGIQKHIYGEIAEYPRQVIRDSGKSYLVQYSWTKFWVPHSFVKEIVNED